MFIKSLLKIGSLFIAVVLFSSCASTQIKVIGKYTSKKTYLNSRLLIKDDKSFYYIDEGLPLALYGKDFYYTLGSWTKQGDTLYLSSYLSPIRKDTISITASKTNNSKSRFTFFSSDGDTLPFFRVDKNSRNIAWIFHSSYMSSEFNVKQGDIFTFWFNFGYSPTTIRISKSDNRIYDIYLQRKFLSAHFKNAKFIIKRNKLIELATKEKYVRTKNGM